MIKLLILMLLLPMISIAETKFEDKFDIAGYLGYRYIWSSIGAAPVNSYPEVGLLLNYNHDNNWSTFVQLNLNNNAIETSMEHSVLYGFLSYQNSIYDVPFRVSIGKLRHEFGLHNANVVNPSTRPAGTVAPQSIYWNNLSSTLTSGYGIHFELYLSDFRFGYTIDQYIVVDERKESLMWVGVPFIKMEPFFGSHQIYNINYEPSDSNIKIKTAFTKLKLNKDFDPIEFITAGIEYDLTNNIMLSAEALVLRGGPTEWTDWENLRYGYSITAEYYLNGTLEIHANYNTYEDKDVDKFFIGATADASRWKDFSVGITKYYKQFEFKADIHKVYGGRTLLSDNWDNPDIDDWWYVGTSIVFHF